MENKDKKQTKQRRIVSFLKLLNTGIKSSFIPVFILTWLFSPFFAFASTQSDLKSRSEYYTACLKKSNIIHIATEFLDAKAGGLGAVVNEIVSLQKSYGHNVTVILPMFQNDDGTPAYKFLDPNASIGLPKKIQAIVGPVVIDALVYEYDIFMANEHIKLKAIKPEGKFTYLTKIKNSSNPYVLSDNAIRAALNLWQEDDVKIKEAREEIEKKIDELCKIENQIKEVSDMLVSKEDTETEDKHVKESRSDIERLSKSRKKLLLTVIAGAGLSFEAVLFKISNEKAYYLSSLSAVVGKDIVLEEDTDFIHVHHFGNELMLIKNLLDYCNYSNPYPVMIKSLHGLNVKLTHLNGRGHPILEGIKNADGIHVVSPGSSQELKEDIEEHHYFYPESRAIDLNKVFVATNGIDYEKFSLTKNWAITKKKFPEELGSFPDTIKDLNLYEQKQLFKKALAEILPGLVKQNRLLSTSWCSYFDPKKPMMLFVGRLCKEKAYERLEIAAEVAKEKGALLVIMGFGDPIFEVKIKEKYPEVIFLNNLQDQGVVGSFLRGGADISLLTSNQETAGLVLLEGQAMGQTVLTSSLPGPISLSNPETFHQFKIATKKGVEDRDSNFDYVDEKATRENFSIQLKYLIDCFALSSKEDILRNMESNVQFAKKFTASRMLAELDALYLASKYRRVSEDAIVGRKKNHR